MVHGKTKRRHKKKTNLTDLGGPSYDVVADTILRSIAFKMTATSAKGRILNRIEIVESFFADIDTETAFIT